MILPGTQAAGAPAVAERMREATRSLNIRHEANPDAIVTLSLGVASMPPRFVEQLPERLVQAADAALYEAKVAGRDCVSVAATPPRLRAEPGPAVAPSPA